MAIAPNPQLASMLGQFKIPANWRSNAALLDYLVSMQTNGVPDHLAPLHMDALIAKMAFAQVELAAIVAEKVGTEL
jgi:hypothetical protein